MLHIIDEAEYAVGCGAAPGVLFRVTDAEKNTAPLCAVMDIALAGLRDIARRALALPVKQCFIDGVILIHCGEVGILISMLLPLVLD